MRVEACVGLALVAAIGGAACHDFNADLQACLSNPRCVPQDGGSNAASDGGTDSGTGPVGSCDAGTWCLAKWYNLQAGTYLYATAGTLTDTWAVGGTGTVVHWNGSTAVDETMTDLGTGDLRAVWVSDGGEAWAVGDIVDAQLNRLTAVRRRAAGAAGQWSSQLDDRLPSIYTSVWGSGPNDVWIGGNGGLLAHWTGQRPFTYVDAGTTLNVDALWGTGPADVWAALSNGVQANPTLLHYDGSSWTGFPVPGPQDQVVGFWGLGPRDLWAVAGNQDVLIWRGSNWTVYGGPLSTAVSGISGVSDTKLFAAGTFGELVQYDGVVWTPVPTNGDLQVLHDTAFDGGYQVSFNGLWANPNEVWVCGELANDGFLLRYRMR